ncbi:hypothetical protein R69658_07943 [Paraburkholderia aspalathi]|uniref:Transposase n=1 Tax=Paraburkholderia aspalathi TaxID=1324617 RepID=A0ABM8T862_9BURK|nr:hypothetical protein R69658_07943 [Paraburkholderia aspalathi]
MWRVFDDEGAAPIEIPKTQRTVPEQAQRKPLPDHLPRDVQTFLLESIGKCSKCGAPMKPLDEDVSEQLEYVPASFRVIHHVRPKFACSCCDHTAQAAAPSRPVERSLAGSGLLAHVLAWKFADSLSLYRQSVTYARQGVGLDRSLLAKWVGHAATLLEPLDDALRRHVMAATKLDADVTPVPVLALGNGKKKTGRLWVYVRDVARRAFNWLRVFRWGLNCLRALLGQVVALFVTESVKFRICGCNE